MYQKVPLGVFKASAHYVAKIVIAQMPLKDRKMEEAKIRGEISSRTPDGKVGKATRSQETPVLQDGYTGSSSPKLYKTTRVQSLRDTIVAPYPHLSTLWSPSALQCALQVSFWEESKATTKNNPMKNRVHYSACEI